MLTLEIRCLLFTNREGFKEFAAMRTTIGQKAVLLLTQSRTASPTHVDSSYSRIWYAYIVGSNLAIADEHEIA